MGASTTHPILSMWIIIYSFSDTYYFLAACGITKVGMTNYLILVVFCKGILIQRCLKTSLNGREHIDAETLWKKKIVCMAKHTNWAFLPKIFLGRRISVPRHAFRSPSKVLGCILQIFDNFFIIVLKIVVIMIITVIIIMINNYWRVVKRKGNIIACARVNRRIFATFSRIFNDLTHRSRGRIYELYSKVEKAG